MSEAMDMSHFLLRGDAFVVAQPDLRFAEILENFYRYTRQQLGGRALLLTSDRRLRVFEDPITNEFRSHNPDVITTKQLNAMQTDLRRRDVRLPVDSRVEAEPESGRPNAINETLGFTLRFGITVDALTTLAIKNAWLMPRSATSLPMHLTIPRKHMNNGTRLLDARDELLAALAETPPLTVEDMHISSPDIHI